MDKEEFRIKLEQINTLVEKKDYKGAMEVVDSIDWRRVKNVRTLCIVGEIYAANQRYEDSREIFLLAYHRSSIGKNILIRLIDVSLKMNDVEDAEEFYDEFCEVAPNDSTKYVLRYRIDKAKKAPLEDQIKILEEYKEREFTEKWAYELAELYYRAGENEKCLSLCSEIILWFNEGKYVMKCYDLKNRMGSLTDREKNIYESMKSEEADVTLSESAEKENKGEESDTNAETKEDEAEVISTESEENASENVDPEIDFSSIPQIDSIHIRGDKDLKDAETLQEKISKGFRDIFGSKAKSEEDENADSEELKEEIQEEMIKDSSMTEDEIANIPELEKEDEVTSDKADKKEGIFGSLLHMPNVILGNSNLKDSLKVPEVPNLGIDKKNEEKADELEDSFVSDDETEEAAEEKKTAKVFDFNSLEDTILAAASAQGIEIPEKEEKNNDPVPVAEEEEVTEEDLRLAEEEFMNGPIGKTEIKEKKEPVVMSLESEESLTPKQEQNEEEEEEENSFINEILGIRKSPKKTSQKVSEKSDEKEKEILNLDFENETSEEAEAVSEEEDFDQTDELEKFLAMFDDEDEEKEHIVYAREKQLSDEEKKLFTYFIKVPGMKEQLIEMLCKVQEGAVHSTSSTGNIMVMGGKETGKTRLISAIIPAICKQLGIEATKVAYVFAEQINGKDVKRMVEKLAGGFFVIENINQLDAPTAEKLSQALSKDTKGMIVIVEDEKIGMRKFIMKYPKLAKKFTSMINIPVFTNDELVNFARVYTRENGFKIDQMGMLALYNLISENQKADEPMNIGVVKELLDNAIAKASGGLFKRTKKRMDRDGYIVLQEKDFS